MTQKKINNYVIYMDNILGKGSFGMVYEGLQENTKKIVAVKVLQKGIIEHDQYLKQALFSEIRILQLLKSENVIKVLDVMQSSHNYYIIQEICESDLQKHLYSKPNLSEEQAIDFLKQICNGFITLVKEGIVHRDLKPANIMVHKGVIKIGDFGFAKRNTTKRIKNQTSVGTPLYMPPQVLKSQPYTSKCDVWATGVIFYQMLHKKTPWTAHSEYQLVKNLQKKDSLVIHQNLKEETKSFLIGCLGYQQSQRFSWDQVFLHPIFSGYFNQYALQSKQFENKLKMVMAQLRFEINSKNIDLTRLLESLNLSGVKELNYHQFQKFIKHIHPIITKEQIKFFFEKMDTNEDGSVSLTQLSAEMEKHYISFSKFIPGHNNEMENNGFKVKKTNSMNECFINNKLSSQLQSRVKKCFLKLYKIITQKKITLYKTFEAYDHDKKGSLTLEQFQKIMASLDKQFTHQDIIPIFDFLDAQKQKKISFDELRSYYCKVNGIAQTLEKPQHSQSHSHSHHPHSHHSNSKHSSSSHSHHHHHHHSKSSHSSNNVVQKQK